MLKCLINLSVTLEVRTFLDDHATLNYTSKKKHKANVYFVSGYIVYLIENLLLKYSFCDVQSY